MSIKSKGQPRQLLYDRSVCRYAFCDNVQVKAVLLTRNNIGNMDLVHHAIVIPACMMGEHAVIHCMAHNSLVRYLLEVSFLNP